MLLPGDSICVVSVAGLIRERDEYRERTSHVAETLF